MKKSVSDYKKAARALRTFNKKVGKLVPSGESEEHRAKRLEYYQAQATIRNMLDETLGQQALCDLYWEGKEL